MKYTVKSRVMACLLLLLPVVLPAQAKKDSLNDSLVKELSAIGWDDQLYRNQMDDVSQKYGGASKEMRALFAQMRTTDSLNLLKVSAIIDRYGWLGPEVVGTEGNTTLFMVIQHADLPDQEKYLPLFREAVKKGKAKAAHLALLEDRVALREGRKQLYGSQLSWDMRNNQFKIMPLEDPDNVDKRRAAVGLEPYAGYLMECCRLTWDVAQYKKQQAAESAKPAN